MRICIYLISTLFICLLQCISFANSTVDLYDSALLFNSKNEQNSDINFRKISEYYGIKCKVIDISFETLTDDLLKDENGKYFKAININANTLESGLLSTTELDILKYAIKNYSLNLLVSGISKSCNILGYLTDNIVIKAVQMSTNNDWIFSRNYPDISRELTVQIFSFNRNNSAYYIDAAIPLESFSIISSKDEYSKEVPVFIVLPQGSGKIFVDGIIQSKNLRKYKMAELYDLSNFHNIIPSMMFVRYSLGDECWHNNHNYANLTIDDPDLSQMEFKCMNYDNVLSQMLSHPFHLTVGFIPKNYSNSNQEVVNLFLNNKDKFSIVQHGNNHDGAEFICYTQEQLDTLNVIYNNTFLNQRPRSIYEQEADIMEGRTRMKEFEKLTGIECGNVMILPYGITLSPTFALLKAYNFNAIVNRESKPPLLLNDDYKYIYDFNFDMKPANMNFENFAVVKREHPSTYNPIVFYNQKWPLKLFIDKHLLLYSHACEIFKDGADGFNAGADMINAITGNVEWKPLHEIIKKMYLEKTNDDGSIDVEFYGNNVIISNETDKTNFYHIKKREWFNVPIIDVKIDGRSTNYSFTDSTLELDLPIFPNSSKEVQIIYSSGDKDFCIEQSDVYFNAYNFVIKVKVHNYGSAGGPVSVGFLEGDSDSEYSALKIVTIERIESKSNQIISIDASDFITKIRTIKVDPNNVIVESNENNNAVKFDPLGIHTTSPTASFKTELLQNYPNPFKLGTVIKYTLEQDCNVNIKIYNIIGQHIITIVNDDKRKGKYAVVWDGKDDAGKKAPDGIYIYKFETSFGYKEYRKMILLR